MKEKMISTAARWSTAAVMMTLGGLAACSSAGMGEADAEIGEPGESSESDAVDSTTTTLLGGYTTEGCNKAETLKIHDALAVLIAAGTTGFDSLKKCLSNAPFVENQCKTGAMVAEYFRRKDVMKIKCYDSTSYEPQASKVSGEQMSLGKTLLAREDATFVAGVIAHGLMHNRGLLHKANASGSKFYPNTVPEQARACIVKHNPNPWQGSGTAPSQTAGCTIPQPDCRTGAKPFCCEPGPSGGCIICAQDGASCP